MGTILKELFYAEETRELDYLRRAGCQFAAYSSRAPDKESANEDCAGWIRLGRNRWVFVVADGLGGLPAGENASRLAVSIILDYLTGVRTGEQTRASILSAIDAANAAILESGSGGATTLVVVEFDNGMIRPYHVGDATILVTGQRGLVKFHTVSHSPTAYLEQTGLLDEQGAMVHEDRHLVYNVVGSDTMRLEIGSLIALDRYDTVVMASDGLSDNLSQGQVVDLICTGHLEKSLGRLASACCQAMTCDGNGPAHPDDLTILAIRRSD